MDFAVTAQPQGDSVVVVNVQGEVDVYTAPKLREEIHRQMDDGATTVIVDLADVAYMDSSGLGVLIGALKRAREKEGDMVVASANPRITRILDVTGLSRIFNVQPDVKNALAHAKGQGND